VADIWLSRIYSYIENKSAKMWLTMSNLVNFRQKTANLLLQT